MAIKGLDYAWTHVPMGEAARYVGKDGFICRYASSDPGKDLSWAEAKLAASFGVWCVLVYETTTGRATAGFAAGQVDAAKAKARAKLLHMPDDRPIYFAVDFDSAGPDVLQYFKGLVDVLGKQRVGVYGGFRVCSYLWRQSLVGFVWQTYAWSGGSWFTTNHIRQVKNDIVIGGVGCDADEAYPDHNGDYGQWMPDVSPLAYIHPQELGDDVASNELRLGHNAVTIIKVKPGEFTALDFGCDNGIQGLSPAIIRVALQHFMPSTAAGATSPVWGSLIETVDSKKDPVSITLPANVQLISVRREDAGDVHVGWSLS